MGSSSGLIIAFVVAVWAAYFVPLALRRYDEATKNASVESSGFLSRVINRPEQASQPELTVSEPVIEAAVVTPEAPKISSKAARVAAARRRRTLLTLLALAAIVGGVAGFGVIPLYSIAAPVALIVAWLVACRLQVRTELGISRSARQTAAESEDTITISGQFEDINPGRKHVMEDVPLETDALDDQIVIAVPSVSTTGEALWDPLPVTLPTYVTKPRAGRTVRTIDFGAAGAWTSGHIEGEDVEMPGRESADEERRATGS
ncbi:divisome protein SepX/GlpR [Aeromicrobium sp.]|uniref:divisome protein SepX/GlpR n=1 Tax=Aeromicrobium sp. TaxID=1871063 RepID=UPI002FC61091